MGKQRGRREKTAVREREEAAEPEPASEFSSVFFGLVDEAETSYFRQAESTLNTDAFASSEERDSFVNSVFEESKGKELKLVTTQICSKLVERLVLLALDPQLKALYGAFLGKFAALAHHKYALHVLETLFVRSAGVVEAELAAGEGDDFVYSELMEAIFLAMLEEMQPYWLQMAAHAYASHVLRILVLVVAGKELPSPRRPNALRLKKLKIARKMIDIRDSGGFDRAFQTPPSFRDQLKRMVHGLSQQWDTARVRELAIHKIGSPVLQLVLRVEGMVDRDRLVWHMAFLPEKSGADEQEAQFVEYLLSDAVGSHFLEAAVKNEGVRLKFIERLYRLYMAERVLKLAKRATTGVYVVQALLTKLRPNDVQHILDAVIPELAGLVLIADSQNLELGRAVIDALIARYNYRRSELIAQLFLKFAPNYDPAAGEASTELFENVLQLTGSTLGNTRGDWPTADERRRALFLQKLMEYEPQFVECVWLNCMALPPEKLVQMCTHGVFAHVVECSLVVAPSEPKRVHILRKKLLNLFAGKVADLACNAYGLHIVDKFWLFTVLLPMYKDRMALELAAELHKVKESQYGKMVWKNWLMDLFLRKKYDWKLLVREQEREYHGAERGKTPIELKMELLREAPPAKRMRS